MAASNGAETVRVVLSRWTRDYRLSRAILVAGLAVLGTTLAFDLWADWTGNVPASGGTGLLMDLTGTAGFALVFAGAIFTYHNWSLIQAATRLTARRGGDV